LRFDLPGLGEKGKKILLPVECGQQLRGGNEALNNYIKPDIKLFVKQKIRHSVNFKFSQSHNRAYS